MYRAIRMFNGGEQVKFTHFMRLEPAYRWLEPSLERQVNDKWHIKVYPEIFDVFVKKGSTLEMIGYNERDDSYEETTYIQVVVTWNDALPHF
jgi:hypothetical protein